MSAEACADLLHVTERTVRNWESGSSRIPYAAFKLVRVMRGGKFLGPEWHGWYVRYDRLITPEGHEIRAHEFAWWSLLVRQAREFQRLMRERRQNELDAPPAVAVSDGRPAATTAAAIATEHAADAVLASLVANAAEGALGSPQQEAAPGPRRHNSGSSGQSASRRGRDAQNRGFSAAGEAPTRRPPILDPIPTPRASRHSAKAVRP